MELRYAQHHCKDCELSFLVAEQENVFPNPYCPNCGDDFCVEFVDVLYISMRRAFKKDGE